MGLTIHYSLSQPSETRPLSRKASPRLLLVALLGFGGIAAWNSPAESAQPAPAPVSVTPRSYWASKAFDDLARQGGPKVLVMGGSGIHLVPMELIFKPVEGRKLVNAVAAAYELKVAWVRDEKYAILYAGAADQEVARLKDNLTSADRAVRCDAARRGGWLLDPRIVPLLVKAAKDVDANTARKAVVGLGQMGWDVVLALDDNGWEFLAAKLASHDSFVRSHAAYWLRRVGGEKALELLKKQPPDPDAGLQCCGVNQKRLAAIAALQKVGTESELPLIENALTDEGCELRREAVVALGRIGGEKALALIKKALADQDAKVRREAVVALGSAGGEKDLPFIEKALADLDANVRGDAANSLLRMGKENVLALFEKALADQDPHMRLGAAQALGRVSADKTFILLEKALNDEDVFVRREAANSLMSLGGKRVFVLLEKALADKDADVRAEAARAVGCVGGEKALALIERALADNDNHVRYSAVQTLRWPGMGGDKALLLLEKAFADQYEGVRCFALQGLATVGGEKALPLLEKALADQDFRIRSQAAWALGNAGGDQALTLLEKAVTDQNSSVRRDADSALAELGGEKARDILLERLPEEKDQETRSFLITSLLRCYAGDPKVEKALKEAAQRQRRRQP